MCIWSVYEFPDYGLFASCVTKGHIGCPPCGLAFQENWRKWYIVGVVVIASKPPLYTQSNCIQLGNRKQSSTYTSICIKHYQMGNGMKGVVTRSKESRWQETWPHTQKWHQVVEYYVPTSILGGRCTYAIFNYGIMNAIVQTMNYHVIMLQAPKIIIKTLIILKS
jgi:hypothetical protein